MSNFILFKLILTPKLPLLKVKAILEAPRPWSKLGLNAPFSSHPGLPQQYRRPTGGCETLDVVATYVIIVNY